MAFLVPVGRCESESMRTLISERHASRSVGLVSSGGQANIMTGNSLKIGNGAFCVSACQALGINLGAVFLGLRFAPTQA